MFQVATVVVVPIVNANVVAVADRACSTYTVNTKYRSFKTYTVGELKDLTLHRVCVVKLP